MFFILCKCMLCTPVQLYAATRVNAWGKVKKGWNMKPGLFLGSIRVPLCHLTLTVWFNPVKGNPPAGLVRWKQGGNFRSSSGWKCSSKEKWQKEPGEIPRNSITGSFSCSLEPADSLPRPSRVMSQFKGPRDMAPCKACVTREPGRSTHVPA